MPSRVRTVRRSSIVASLLAVALTLATAGRVAAAEPRIGLDDLRVAHETIVLDNGLTVVVHEDHSVPIVAVNLWYHVGSRNERPGRTGFAHLFEHFFFNGSENYPHGFREAMDDLGANNRNGTTSTDRTNFFEDVPVSALERTLYLESDRMGHLAGHISQEMLERERGVVQNEKRQGENQPYGRVFSRLVETIYPASHPYSWSTIGRLEDLEAASLDDIREWYATYYGPNNCVLALAGDITVERARELATRYFGAIPPGPPIESYEAWVPELESNLRDVMQDRVPQARVYRVWHVPGWGDEALPLLELATDILAGSKSAPLTRRLVYEKELATSVSTFVWNKELAGNVFVIATVKPGVDPAEVERELDAVLAGFLAAPPAGDVLERSRTRLLAPFARGLERLGGFGGRSDVLAESATFGGDPDAYLEFYGAMLAATPADVRGAATRWLGPERHHMTLTVVPFPELAAGEETIDRGVLPPLGEPPEVRFPAVQRAELSNGLKVLLLERRGVPIVNATLALDAGSAADGDRPGIASMTLDLMEEGTTSLDGFELADALDTLGASISTGNSLDQSYVRLRALSPALGPSLDLFADVVRNPAFAPAMVELGTRNRLATIAQEKATPFSTALRVMPAILYGAGHPYANPLTGSGTEASISSLTREDLVRWHGRWFAPNAATLIVAGDVSLAELRPLAEAAFGAWKRHDVPTKSIGAAPEPPGERPVYVIDKPGAPQSVIVATHVSLPGGQPQDLAGEVLLRNFGGMATSRLNRNLRLDKHWSYGTFGGMSDARGPRPFYVVAPVQSDRTKEAMLEVAAEIRGVAGERPVRGEEFESIMRNMVSRLPGRFETLSSLESAAEDLVNYGLPDDWFATYSRRVRALDEDDLAAAGRAFVDPGRLTWIVIGDLATIEAGIRELDWGPIVRLDPDGLPLGAPPREGAAVR